MCITSSQIPKNPPIHQNLQWNLRGRWVFFVSRRPGSLTEMYIPERVFSVVNLKHEVCSDEIGGAVLLRAIFRRHCLANIVGLEIWHEAGSSKSSNRQVFFQFCSERFTDSLLVYNSLLPVNCKGKSNFDNSKIYPVWLQKSKNVQVERKTDTLKDGYILIL